MRKKFVVFDFDGTVLDTNQLIIDSWQYTFRKYHGYEHSEREILDTFGETLYDSMKEFFPGDTADMAIESYRDYQLKSWKEDISVFPGVEDLLETLKEREHSLLLVTSRLKPTTMEYLEYFGLRDYFDVVITSNDTKAHKPDPEPLLTALDKAGGRPENSIMLGDTRFDIGCANNAGAESVLVHWSHPVDETKLKEPEFTPDYRLSRPEDLMALV